MTDELCPCGEGALYDCWCEDWDDDDDWLDPECDWCGMPLDDDERDLCDECEDDRQENGEI